MKKDKKQEIEQPINDTEENTQELDDKFDEILGRDEQDDTPSSKPQIDEAYVEEELDELPDGNEEVVEEEDNQDEPEDDKPESEDDGDDTEIISDRLVISARACGLSDESIVKLAESNPDYLEVLAKAYERMSAKPQVDDTKRQTVVEHKEETKIQELVSEEELASLDEKARNVLSKIINKVAHNSEQLLKRERKEQEIELSQSQQYDNLIDTYFDSVRNKVPEVGASRFLSPENEKVRIEIHEYATSLQRNRGLALEDALEKAVEMYTVLTKGNKSAESDLIRKINKNKKRFTPRPGGQKTKKKFETQEQEQFDDFDKSGREIGLW